MHLLQQHLTKIARQVKTEVNTEYQNKMEHQVKTEYHGNTKHQVKMEIQDRTEQVKTDHQGRQECYTGATRSSKQAGSSALTPLIIPA